MTRTDLSHCPVYDRTECNVCRQARGISPGYGSHAIACVDFALFYASHVISPPSPLKSLRARQPHRSMANMASQTTAPTTLVDTYMDRHPKRRRLSLRQSGSSMSIDLPPKINASQQQVIDRSDGGVADKDVAQTHRRTEEQDTNIGISATSKLAGQTVAPFLARHIPEQYAPLGGSGQLKDPANKNPNTKYCYRHRPDLKCRRQVDEPSMDQLQHVCTYL